MLSARYISRQSDFSAAPVSTVSCDTKRIARLTANIKRAMNEGVERVSDLPDDDRSRSSAFGKA